MVLEHMGPPPRPVQQLQRVDHIVVHDTSNQTGFFRTVQILTISRGLSPYAVDSNDSISTTFNVCLLLGDSGAWDRHYHSFGAFLHMNVILQQHGIVSKAWTEVDEDYQ